MNTQKAQKWGSRTALTIIFASFTLLSFATDTTRPWTFWYWMYGAVSKPGIKADLQAMKDVGLGGCYLMPIRGTEQAPANLPPIGTEPAQQLTPQFWELVDYALTQADSLGLEMGIHICDGFALAGGPWITPEESMQQVVWSDTIVTIPPVPANGVATVAMPQPAAANGYYEDIAVFAVPVYLDLPAPRVYGTIAREADGSFRSKEPGYIQYDFDHQQIVASLHIVPSGNNVQAQRLLVQASDDGTVFRDIRQLTPPLQGWQNTGQAYTYSLPKTLARHFRFCWTPEGTPPGSEDMDAAKWSPVLKLKSLTLSSTPVIDQYESKNGSVWRIAGSPALTSIPTAPPQASQYWATPVRLEVKDGMAVIPTSFGTTGGGQLRIMRFGHTTTGHTNATAGGAKGLECDKFSVQAVEKQIDHWFGAFMQRPHHEVVKYMHVDSWECGSQNWSRNFAEEFQKRRGYDLLPYLPVYAGVRIDHAEQVLRDIRLTINDLLQDVFFQTVSRRAKQYGVQLSCESVAPTMVSDGMEHYKHADLPMGEFWLNSPTHDKPNDMLDAISGAHVYDKNIVQAEGFTEVRGVWDETPASIKPLLDRNLALGMNRLFFHVFTHNPYTDKTPGMTLDGIGLFFQRDQTWFPESKALVDYVTRCQKLLQEGRPVVDIAVFTGEEMPRRALTPDKLVPMLPGLFGPERVASEQQRIANAGCPMEESPVGVRHNANILDLKDWVNPLHGYHYDSMNKDALLNMPFDYKVLVIPNGCLVSDEVRKRIEQLRQQGVAIIEQPYKEADFSALGVEPDVILPDGITFTHRHMGEFGEVYFLSNQENRERTFTASFRAGLYSDVVIDNPMMSGYIMMDDCAVNNPRTDVPLTLPAYGSVFVHLSSARGYWPLGHQRTPISTCLHQKKPANFVKYEFTNGWDISFKENGMRIHSDTLFDWSRHKDNAIRFFSGHARYATTLRCKNKPGGNVQSSIFNLQSSIRLSLGDVRDVAHVWVNGQDCGIAWMPPYEVDITHALKNGKNKIEIEVVNTWHNALRGLDQGTPPYPGIWTNAKYRTKGDALLPAGLLGPVELRNGTIPSVRTIRTASPDSPD